jgi:hypothetical protein
VAAGDEFLNPQTSLASNFIRLKFHSPQISFDGRRSVDVMAISPMSDG